MSFGGMGKQPPTTPHKAPRSPTRNDKSILRKAKKQVGESEKRSSTLNNLLSAHADGMVGAASPTRSVATSIMTPKVGV